MKPAVLVAVTIFASLLGSVSARLLRLAVRTRRTPELLLGLSMAFPLAGYATAVVGAAIGGGVPPQWVAEVTGAVCDLGFIATAGFVWVVFRERDRWARMLLAFIVIAFAAMPFVNHFVSWEHGVPSALVARGFLRTICYGWAAIESLRYARLMRRRVHFGLAEPLVADRFSLWGLAHLCLALMMLLIMAGVRLHLTGAGFAPLCTLSGLSFGLIATVPLLLSFFPPDKYAHYVEQRFRREGVL